MICAPQNELFFTAAGFDPASQRRSKGLGRLFFKGARIKLLTPNFKQLDPIPAYAAFGGFLPFSFGAVPK